MNATVFYAVSSTWMAGYATINNNFTSSCYFTPQIDKKVITKLAVEEVGAESLPVLKTYCDKIPKQRNVTLDNGTTIIEDYVEKIRCE